MKLFLNAFLAVQFLAVFAFAQSSEAITLNQLRNIPGLTPQRFARCFADFEFKFHEEVQDPEVFLKTKSGDCDDYATVAADVLARHGYTPRMFAVRMKGETHVICYISETGSYLDYNCRKDADPMVKCSPEITEIARKVAQSFGRDWVATYEFTYEDKTKRLVNNIISNRPATKTASRVTESSGAPAQSGKHSRN